jgi:hypothetical protein
MSTPYDSYTRDGSVVATAIQTLLKGAAGGLGVQDVWYGEQTNIPRFPALTVDPAPVKSTLNGVPMMLRNDFTVYVYVYLAKIGDLQATRLACEQLAEAVRDVIHTDKTLGGNIIQGWVTEIEPGFARKSGALLVADRITFEGMDKRGV